MKFPSIPSSPILTVFAGLTTLSAFSAPALAETAKFSCGVSEGAPATLVQTERGKIRIIRWVSDAFGSEYPPEYRCQVVSPKFQQYHKEGKLNFLTTGVANNQPIICAADTKGGPCTGILFTLKAGSDPWLTLTRLMNVRIQAGPALNESAGSSSSAGSEQYVDMSEYLSTAPLVEEVTPEVAPANNTSGTPIF